MNIFMLLNLLKHARSADFHLGGYDRGIEPDSGLFSFKKFFTPEIKNKKSAFTLAEIMVSILVVAIIAALMIPAFIGNANDKSLSTQYSKMEKDIISQLESLATMEGVQNFDDTSMVKKVDDNDYKDNAQAFLMKHFNVTKACTTARDCFPESRKYKNEKGENYSFTPDGACGHLKNGSVMCITPRYYVKDDSGAVKKDTDVKIWLDLNGKRKPNVYGEDLYIFQLKVTGQGKTKLSFDDDESNDNILDGLRLVKLTHDCSAEEFDAFCCKSDSYIEGHNQCCDIEEYKDREACNPTPADPCPTTPSRPDDECCSDPNHPEYANLPVCKTGQCKKMMETHSDISDMPEYCCSVLKLTGVLDQEYGDACCQIGKIPESCEETYPNSKNVWVYFDINFSANAFQWLQRNWKDPDPIKVSAVGGERTLLRDVNQTSLYININWSSNISGDKIPGYFALSSESATDSSCKLGPYKIDIGKSNTIGKEFPLYDRVCRQNSVYVEFKPEKTIASSLYSEPYAENYLVGENGHSYRNGHGILCTFDWYKQRIWWDSNIDYLDQYYGNCFSNGVRSIGQTVHFTLKGDPVYKYKGK